jgi:ABC-2 type transport system ATP-binding protein
MQDVAIRTDKLTKRFGDLVAVDQVSFDVMRGEIFGLLGPNGAGKTTLIRILCTLSRPSEGTATVSGYDIRREDSRVREQIGLVSEKMIMYDRLTAEENLRLFGKLYDIPSDVLSQRIEELLDLVRMKKWADHKIGTFSTGMKQRINVIRALLNQPNILFLDEPTLGLDPQSSGEIREFIRNINMEHKTTIILTTHMMVEADMLCNRVGIIDYGKISAMDSPRNLKRIISGTDATVVELHIPNLSTRITSQIKSLDCINNVMVEDDTHIKVQAEGDEAFDNIIDCVRTSGGKIYSVKNLEPTLEDVFLHITGHEVREQTSDKVKTTGPGHGPRHESRPKKRIR